jgi:signal peptidase I
MRRRLRRVAKDVATVAAIALMVTAARSSLADHYVVPTGSMEYTLLPGDRVLVDKTAYGLRLPFVGVELLETGSPERGDVVVFDSPETGTRLVKRVVAVGGDVASLRDGHLSINGVPMGIDGPWDDAERFGTHLAQLNLSAGGGPDISTVRVPPGYLLVIGDFRGNSRDGRFFGLIPEDRVYGRAVSVFHRRDEGFVWLSL